MDAGLRKGFFPLYPGGVFPSAIAAPPPRTSSAVPAKEKDPKNAEARLREDAADLPSALDVELRYEVIKEAGGVVQLQMIDVRDDSVVRKAPSDEVISFLKYLQDLEEEERDDRLDVVL
ncbi:MAG: flagellar protein FlaG [Synergistaceae bacterium]|jgi:hypothetical protein|nr:flagellar protein FlaG [Synergistaceae bacterium]